MQSTATKTCLVGILFVFATSTLVYAATADDEVRRAQLWHDIKLKEHKQAQVDVDTANTDLVAASEALKKAQAEHDRAQAALTQAQAKATESNKAIDAANHRLDEAWKALEKDRKN